MYYDEKDKCEKCGKQLKSEIINYDFAHDGGIYNSSYKKVDRQFAKEVGLGFYCNDCYSKIGNSKISEIIENANTYLQNDITSAIDEVTKHYEDKIKQLKEIQKYIEDGISFLTKKNTISELTKEEINYLLKRCYIYEPAHQRIQNGFCPFSLSSEVRILT